MTDARLLHLQAIEQDVTEIRRRLAAVDRKLQWVTGPSRIAELEWEGAHLLDMLEALDREGQTVEWPPAA